MTIVPDDKDWTWVLARPCPDCGFDPREHPRDGLADELRGFGPAWAALLARPRAAERPRPEQWSGVEYGCHVADALDLGVVRITRMLIEDDPLFANWDQDVTAVEQRYDLQAARPAAARLTTAADAIGGLVDEIQGDAWTRPGRRGDGSAFTVESFVRYLVHDPVHHLWDVVSGYRLLG